MEQPSSILSIYCEQKRNINVYLVLMTKYVSQATLVSDIFYFEEKGTEDVKTAEKLCGA